MKWYVVGYYMDGKHVWTLYKNNQGQTKKKKGIL